MTAEDIFLLIKEEAGSMAISTVYRNMEALQELGVIAKTIFNDGKARYELSRENHVHHLICLNCKKSVTIDKCPLEQMEKELKERAGFDVMEHKLEIYGYCEKCKRQNTKDGK
jgi:Fur family ferric uptake transcriptional regulator